MAVATAAMFAFASAADDPSIGRRPAEKGPRVIQSEFHGQVTAWTDKIITIHMPKYETTETKTTPAGPVKTVVVIPAETRTFTFGTELATGRYIKKYEVGWYSYRITDLQVNDWVRVRFSQVGDAATCEAIRIELRPGGKIPPAPGDTSHSPHMYHEQVNRAQEELAKEAQQVKLPAAPAKP